MPPLTRDPTRHRQRIERALRPVMIITALEHINMQRNLGAMRPALQPVMDHLRTQLSDLFALEVEGADEEGAGRDVEHGAGERFVKGGVGRAEAGDAGAGT